jgi:hypothetical protein
LIKCIYLFLIFTVLCDSFSFHSWGSIGWYRVVLSWSRLDCDFSIVHAWLQKLLPVLAKYSIFIHLNSLIWLLNDFFKDFFLTLFFLEYFSN